MMLTPRESEKLLVYVAADVARKRQARGLKLNVPMGTDGRREDSGRGVRELQAR